MLIYRNPKEYVIPNIDLLTYLFDSPYCLANESTPINAEAADPSIVYTRGEARIHVQRLAYALRHHFSVGTLGAGRDVVTVISSGQAYLPVALYATIAAGGVYSAASAAYNAEELARQVRDGSSNLIICSRDVLAVAKGAANACGIPEDRVLVLESSPVWRVYDIATKRSILGTGSERLAWECVTDKKILAERPTCLIYSSGTTGLPKGVVLSNANMVSQSLIPGLLNREYLADREAKGDPPFQWRTIAHLPTAHIAGLMGFMINPFSQGGLTYWMPKFDFNLFVRYNKQLQITHFFTVPPIYLLIAKNPAVTDQFRSARSVISGAAPMGADLQDAATAKLGDESTFLQQTWGLSENAGMATLLPWGRKDTTGSVGEILPNMSLRQAQPRYGKGDKTNVDRLIDDDGNDVPAGASGEILIKGPMVFRGYHKRAEENLKAFIGGWFCTGDVGEMRGGLLYIVDRKKELIKYKGLQVAPAEIEALLLSHELIMDAAVIGVDQNDTEVPRAFIVADPNKIDARTIREFVKKNLAAYKQLRGGVTFVDSIPKSPSGKILRRELRDRVRKEALSKL